jgi:predicted nucleic acid-binding protein
VIVLDTTVLLYAVGAPNEIAQPCRALLAAIRRGRVRASTTVEVIQEFVHVRARRRTRDDATRLGRAYAQSLAPLLVVDEGDLRDGLQLFERLGRLGAFDAVLAAAAVNREAEALISADSGFGAIPDLDHIDPRSVEMERFLSE